MTYPVAELAERDRIRAAIAELTEPRAAVITHAGQSIQTATPSLWDLSSQALIGGMERLGPASDKAERSPLDFELMHARGLIRRATIGALVGFSQPYERDNVPAALGQLARYVVKHDQAHLWWWDYRFSSWARLLSALVGLAERVPQPVRLRDTPCPKCGTRQVVTEAESGFITVPPIVITFLDDAVYGARCDECGETWPRNELEHLAHSIGCSADFLAVS